MPDHRLDPLTLSAKERGTLLCAEARELMATARELIRDNRALLAHITGPPRH
jgi:hypothetical protein